MARPSTSRNAAASVMQVVVSGFLLFALYRYLLDKLGAESLGIWSLVLASTNVARLGGLGLQGTAVRFVARYLARGDRQLASRAAETALVATGLVIGVVLVAAYPLLEMILQQVVSTAAWPSARAILPLALGSLWLGAMGGVVQSALDGCQRADARSVITMGSNAAYFVLTVALVPMFGLQGVAAAQLGQGMLLLASGWLSLRSALGELPRLPWRIDRQLLGAMLRYGANVQAETALAMLHDPIAKALLAHFGGLAMVGYFEMATRLALQLRALVTAAFQVLVPVIADFHENSPARLRELYRSAAEDLLYVASPAFGALVATAPLVGRLWIGREEPAFTYCLSWLAAGWFINAASAPAMNANFGTGHITSHTIGALFIAVANAALAFLFGAIAGANGVVVSWVAALSLGSVFVMVAYHHRTSTPLTDLVSVASSRLVLASSAGAAMALVVDALGARTGHALAAHVVAPLLFGFTVAGPLWTHPARRRFVGGTGVLRRLIAAG